MELGFPGADHYTRARPRTARRWSLAKVKWKMAADSTEPFPLFFLGAGKKQRGCTRSFELRWTMNQSCPESDGTNTSQGMTVLLFLFVLNAVVTIVHFVPMLTGHMTTSNSHDVVLRIAIPDIAFAAVPSLVAAWGLWKSRRWGLWLALVAVGAYFHGQMQLLIMAYQGDLGWIMASISLYVIVFNALFALYFWSRRDAFS